MKITQTRIMTRLAAGVGATVALAALATPIIVPPLLAIPNSIGGFINPAGMRLEDFANRAVMWQEGAELKGEWENWRDPAIDDTTIEVLRLRNTAVVFGLDADEVTLQRRDNQPLLFEVRFSTEGEPRVGATRDQLIANINAWSGGSMSAEQPQLDHENVRIRLDADGDSQVRVVLGARTATGQ